MTTNINDRRTDEQRAATMNPTRLVCRFCDCIICLPTNAPRNGVALARVKLQAMAEHEHNACPDPRSANMGRDYWRAGASR
jgi:hypothetical protein